MASDRIKLEPGWTYGEDLEIRDVKVGDDVYFPGTREHGTTKGIIMKGNPKKIRVNHGTFKGNAHEPAHDIITDMDKTRLIGAYVIRDKIVHKVVR